MKKIVIDIVISLLIVACIVLLFSVFFYDKISLSKVIPEPEEYVLSNEMQEDIDETLSEEDAEVITTYFIDASDLKKYEATKEYNKGKKNPFAEESTASTNTSSSSGSGTTTDQPETADSDRFYEDDGTK